MLVVLIAVAIAVDNVVLMNINCQRCGRYLDVVHIATPVGSVICPLPWLLPMKLIGQ